MYNNCAYTRVVKIPEFQHSILVKKEKKKTLLLFRLTRVISLECHPSQLPPDKNESLELCLR